MQPPPCLPPCLFNLITPKHIFHPAGPVPTSSFYLLLYLQQRDRHQLHGLCRYGVHASTLQPHPLLIEPPCLTPRPTSTKRHRHVSTGPFNASVQGSRRDQGRYSGEFRKTLVYFCIDLHAGVLKNIPWHQYLLLYKLLSASPSFSNQPQNLTRPNSNTNIKISLTNHTKTGRRPF